MVQLIAHLFGDFILQSEWMAVNKTKRSWPALVHVVLYSLCFLPLCWVAAQHIPERQVEVQPTRVIIHAADFTSKAVNIDGHYKEPAQDIPAKFHWLALLVILSTHFLIDRFRLARYVVWAKNWMAARWIFTPADLYRTRQRNHPWKECRETGFSRSVPDYMATWLLIIVDNTLHLAINYAALRWL